MNVTGNIMGIGSLGRGINRATSCLPQEQYCQPLARGDSGFQNQQNPSEASPTAVDGTGPCAFTNFTNLGTKQLPVQNQLLKLLKLLHLQSALARKSGGRGTASRWIVSDFLDSLFLSHQGERKKRRYTYSSLNRITSHTETTGSESFTKTYTYDSYGRVQYENWHTGFGIRNVYNSYGYLSEVKTQDNETVWSSPAYNARGQVTAYDLGANHVSRSWDTYGFPTKILTKDANNAVVLELQCDFDEKRGNLKQRKLTSGTYIIEDFRYDGLNRLVTDSLSSTDYRNTDYADNGNITNRSDVGDFTYSQQNAGPHAVTSLGNTTGTLLPTTSQAVDYTAFNKASHITQGNKDYFITYGPDRLRTKTSLQSGIGDDVLLTKYYALGDFERETDANGTRQLHYIAGGDGLAAIYVKYDTGLDSLYYVMQDHLGSLVGAINAESDHVYRQSFDAWGRARNPEDWTYNNIPDDFPVLRGYTGHEHLKWFGIINMNGRMYDASLCRFLSPDPYVQMPDNSQNFNRYSYCLNNPLVYTDPSGEFIFTALLPGVGVFLDAMCWGAVIGGGIGGIRGAMTEGMTFWDGAWRGAVVGAVGGLMGPMGGAGMSFVENLGVGAIQGAFTGGLDATLWGTDVGQGMLWGAAGGAAFATLTSQNLKNLTKGEGFYTNENVFNNMIERGMDKQAMLDYFGFEGTYIGTTKGPSYVDGGGEGASFYGSTNPKTGSIKYGDLAFDSYDIFNMTYNKEIYHSLRVKNGIPLETQGTELGKHLKYFPEERLGFIHAYKNQGLYPSAGKGLMSNISYYQMQSFSLHPSQYYSAKWWHFIYKIPRRW